MKEVTTAALSHREPSDLPASESEQGPGTELQALLDAMAALGRLDSDLARFERELRRASPPVS